MPISGRRGDWWVLAGRGAGTEVEIGDLSRMMLELQELGCHNINMVTPSHFSPHILLALDEATERGLSIPLVWNTCGWERNEILQLLDGVVDIYLADLKYMDPVMSARYSSDATDYPEVTRTALQEMNRQAGVARPVTGGVISRGLMIRHLVMPIEAMWWIAGNLPADTYVNIMIQYRPAYRAHLYPEIDRHLEREEYVEVVKAARSFGLTNLDTDM
jgi:putative pyruvate formate lyase activating enzyme